MRGKVLGILFFILLQSCSEENLPTGLYHYQVERLLSGQSGTKDWHQVINSENCADSVILHIELVTESNVDSIDISSLVRTSNCTSFDTTFIGRANASQIAGGNLFTDSLIFSSGDFWIVQRVTSKLLLVEVGDNFLNYSAED